MSRTQLPAFCGCLLAIFLSASSPAAGAAEAPSKNDSPAAAAGATAEPTPAIAHDAENAVVKVFATMRYPDLFRPWTKQPPSEVTASDRKSVV